MRSSPRVVLLSVLLCGTILLWHPPLRRLTLTLLRVPFTLVRLVSSALLTLPRMPSLIQENAQLQAALTQRHLELSQLRETLRQVERGQQLLAALPTAQGLIAEVLSRSPIPTQHTVLIDKGTDHHLALDTVVVDAQGVVGRVVETHASTSLVMLLTDPESRVAALIERSRETGLLVGQGQGWCELMYLDADADLQEGDRVLTAGLGGAFPKGLPLGTLRRIFKDEQAGTVWAKVEPIGRLGQLEEVLCLAAQHVPTH